MKSPIYNGLYKYSKMQRIPFNAPGHKGKVEMRTRSLSRLDLYGSSKDGDALNLRELTAVSEDEISRLYKTCRTMYLRNGATGGIYSMLGAYLKHGDKVIVDRECHRAAINGIIIQGLEPVFVNRPFSYQYSFAGGVNLDELEKTIISNKDAKAVYITSPTYYGVVSDIKSIAALVHRYGMKLIVDEALGAHFGFTKNLPSPAAHLGADLSVHSAHKTLGAFGGGALLHVNDPDIDFQRLTDIVRMYETASASPALLCTLENAVFYAFDNTYKFDELIAETEKFRKVICENTPIRWLGSEICGSDCIYDVDPSRIVLNFSHATMSGHDAAELLRRKYNIEVEAESENNVVCLTSIYNSLRELKKLFHALAALSKKVRAKNIIIDDITTDSDANESDFRLTPEKAFSSASDFVSAEASLGRINKRIIYRMPDEIPVIIPGEKITSAHLMRITKILSSGGTVKGLTADNKLEVVGITDSFGI